MSGDLDEFRLVRPLGRGGMGEVYLGHDTVLDRAVAIKLIGARNPDAVARERFLIEARAIARLSHPNVVTIYRVGTTGDGRPFLVQELIRGKSLDRLDRPVAWREVCELAIGIARGLAAAHGRGILHRDVKPANVMVDDHGVARLLDFGLAKLSGGSDDPALATPAAVPLRWQAPVEPAAPVAPVAAPIAPLVPREAVAETRDRPIDATCTTSQPILPPPAAGPAVAGDDAGDFDEAVAVAAAAASPASTLPGTVLGTPRYLAPELWAGEPASPQSDLYALGAMLYELLTGTAPYPQSQIDELRRAAQAGGARPIGDCAPDVHPALARLVMRCLAVAPGERPGSAAVIAHELAAALVGAPAVPEGNPYRRLRAFDAAHRALFFGRGPDVDAIVDRLRGEPLVAVVGDSGIGKSSVCHAGVVPAVLAGGLADRRSWRAVPLVPGRTPWRALRAAIATSGAPAEPADPEAVLRALRPSGGTGALLVIDQLEELVTLAVPDEAARVAEALAAIAAGQVPGVKALLAVRGDFLTRVAALPELGAPLTRGLHLLRPLSAADLREAVVGPARATGVGFETEAMIDALVAAVAGNPGALPLLQFTLAELWQARDAGLAVIPAAALDRLGGVGGGLAGHADAVLLGLGAAARPAARRIALRLVSDARTRAVRARSELADDAAAGEALEALVRGRLVVARDSAAGEPSYELAHEALIRSWGTLRNWLDEEAGQLAARHRLAAGAAEWRRLDRRAELLWTRPQLDEIRALGELTAHERAFVDASRGRVRGRRLARLALLAALPLLALALAGVRLVTARARDRAFAALVEAAAPHADGAARLAAAAATARTAAFARFDADDDSAGEQRWAEARRLAAAAHDEFAAAASQLEAASGIAPDAARPRIAAILAAELELAAAETPGGVGAGGAGSGAIAGRGSSAGDRAGALRDRLRRYDPGLAARWDQPGRIALALDRPARIALHGFACFQRGPDCRPSAAGPTIAGGFEAHPVVEVEAAAVDRELAPGSYLAVITAPDGRVARAPFVVASRERVALTVALAEAAPPGFVAIPEGDFLYGSGRGDDERHNLGAQPLHRVHGQAFWISRTEVTYAQWLAFLRALPPAERKRHLPSGDGVRLDEQPDGRFALRLDPAPAQHYRAAEGEPLVYPARTERSHVRWEQLPVSGVSYVDGVAYAAWLGQTGQVPGARICTAREWEHAARGADGRSFPHGDALRPDEADIDATYGRAPGGFGPDEVGSFPASNSPYDVADLAGNVWELSTLGGAPLYKGGCFYHTAFAAISENRGNPADPNLANVRIGLRICADAARAR